MVAAVVLLERVTGVKLRMLELGNGDRSFVAGV